MLEIKNITKVYKTDQYVQKALDDVSVSFRDNEFAAILGPSGSGKTTLLNIIGGLDRYDEGDLIINGVSTKEYKDKDWDAYRNRRIGFIFQSYNLIGHQTILSNVELALTLSGISGKERKQRAMDALEKVGLKEHVHKKPNQLSGGQMQRVAIARALVNNPEIILADEPTGALDTKTSIQVMDLLKEVAKDRLVIMVTHNPELAHEYATRIVNLKDGHIISDTMSIVAHDEVKEEKIKHTKLSFFTALSLSLNNLLTKKGRTALTSFAGSIGIIGIALILALSNGVNAYIKSQEEDMLGSYPIQLEKQAIDLNSMMKRRSNKSKVTHDKAKIYSQNIVADTVETTENMIKSNDLEKFKAYLNVNGKQIQDDVSAIEYGYNVIPQVYRQSKDKLIKVSPSTLLSSGNQSSRQSSSFSGMNMGGGISSSWAQMVENEKLKKQQYQLIEGQWPHQYNEVALILNERNEISDYTLYTLGLMDYSKMDDLIKKAQNKEKYTDEQQSFTYKQALGLKFRVFAPAQLYAKSDKAFVSKENDDKYVKDHFINGTEVKITAVLRSNDKSSIHSGIGYNQGLTKYLLQLTSATPIVKEQLAHTKTNILTGKQFGKEEKKGNPFFSINTGRNKNNSLIHINTLPLREETVTSYSVQFRNGEDVLLTSHYNENTVLTELPSKTPTKNLNDGKTYTFIGWRGDDGSFATTAQLRNKPVTKNIVYTALFLETSPNSGIEELLPEGISQEDLNKAIQSYIKSQQANNPQANIDEKQMQQYINQFLKTNMGQQAVRDYMQQYASQYLKQYQKQMQKQMQTQMAGYMKKYMQSYIQQYAKKYMNKIKGSMNLDLSNDQLQVLMAQMSDSTPSTYKEVLDKLGYSTMDQPSKIALYPITFESKEKVESFIKKYNKQVKNDDDKVTYTDIIGAVTDSITSIVDTITYVLIAFVAISLVVSSIMIAIITYISVLERTKEIGILRAMGASKGDISKIFNAETFIEGLLSGLFGVIVSWLLCIPANRIIKDLVDVDNVAQLPFNAALILVVISVILTLIAGFLPARMAAKKDPVTALRSE